MVYCQSIVYNYPYLQSGGMVYDDIQRELSNRGFDLCHPIHTSWYNNLITSEGLIESGTLKLLPETSSINDGEGRIYNALLIGNTKSIWPVFLNWLSTQVDEQKKDESSLTDEQALEQITSPFDTFAQSSITDIIKQCCSKEQSDISSYQLFWSNGKSQTVHVDKGDDSTDTTESLSVEDKSNLCFNNTSDSFLVSMQRVATTTGEYWHDNESTKLCVHPEYGTWTAFRVVVAFQTKSTCATADIPPTPTPCPCPVSEEESKAAKKVFEYALQMSSSNKLGYGATLNKSWVEICEYLHETISSGSEWSKVDHTLKPWIQLRDCITVGREKWKYTDAQLLYHYTRDAEILHNELKRIRDKS